MCDAIQLRERITSVFSTALNRDVPSAELDLFESGVLDSLGFVELLLQLEREFGVTTSVEDLEVENFRSIANIADFVLARSAADPADVDGPKVVDLRARR